MYLPRLRKISDVLTQMHAADPDTVITRHFIESLIHSGQLTALKYGDAWLVNLDELYLLLSAENPMIPRLQTITSPMNGSCGLPVKFTEPFWKTILKPSSANLIYDALFSNTGFTILFLTINGLLISLLSRQP